MKQPTQLVPAETKQNTTNGVDRWIRHVGSYISHDMVTSTLATLAQKTNASVTKNLLSMYKVRRQRIIQVAIGTNVELTVVRRPKLLECTASCELMALAERSWVHRSTFATIWTYSGFRMPADWNTT
ncbi:hypothetical protein PILCRDRAFT_816990 [Piloderma croceum F 1598]|uniref:Uncharacterized protein n=1 Tax=Piloderma croceum (strain F 1598) TaxID=765440 RepID=A0A0C3C7W5_PILCF|nr:hypothetical protein PILCRDRAFT_816990 [Piloderma croceum F 1598]